MFLFRKSVEMPTAATALKGRPDAIPTATTHHINGARLKPPFPAGSESVIVGLGCFWEIGRAHV